MTVSEERLREMIDDAQSYIGFNGYDPDPEETIAALSELLALREAVTGPRIKPQIILDLREWAEFEQDGVNVEQGAAIDVILDWYDRTTGLDTRRLPLPTPKDTTDGR